MSALSCITTPCAKLADYVDANFEWIYLSYVKLSSFVAHHYKSYNSFPQKTLNSLQFLIATILCIYGGYFTFFITIIPTFYAIKLFAWSAMKQWYEEVRALMAATDGKLRLEEEVNGWAEQLTYSDGIALYLSKPGIVRKYLHLVVAECSAEMVWKTGELMLICMISIFAVFWSIFVRNIMMSLFIYSMVHDVLFQSYIFHNWFFQSFQEQFEACYVHWSKIIIECALFMVIFIYILMFSWIAGSFGIAMSVTFGCYLMVRNTVTKKYEPYKFGDPQPEIINVAAWIVFFFISMHIQWRLF